MSEPEAAVAIVHARTMDSILLIRRSERPDDPWSGHWSLPGGRRDPGDTDLLHTALRELEEECGIRLVRSQMELAMPPRVARRKAGKYLLVAPFLFRIESELTTVLDPCEAVRSVWMPLPTLQDPARHSLRAVPGMASELYFPAVEMDHVPLWGFTYRLLTDWLGLCPQIEAAARLLEFLLNHGLTLEQTWSTAGTVKEARVRGRIPVEKVLAEFAVPGPHVPAVNLLEVRPDYVHVIGPALEEYFIHAVAEDEFPGTQ